MEKEVVQSSDTTTLEAQSEPQEVAQPAVQVPEAPRQKPWLFIGVSALVLLLLGITGFFAYQNYQLKKQVSETKPGTTPSLVTSPQLTSVEQSPTSAVSNVENSTVVFEKEGKIFLLKGLSAQPTEVAKGNGPTLSPDRSKIAYVRMDEDNNIHLYEIDTAKTEVIQTNERRLRGVSWSLNAKYLITDSGTGPIGGGAVFEYPAGNKIASFGTYGKIEWINNNELVFVEPQEISPPRPYGGGQGSGLAKVKLPNGERQILVQANGLEDFSLLKVKNGIVYFSKRTVKANDDWSYHEKQETTYWQMNSDSSGKKTISKPEILSEKVAGYLPTEFSGYRIFSGPILHPSLSNWVIFDINKEGSIYNDPICVMDLNNPQGTFKQIATGSYPSW